MLIVNHCDVQPFSSGTLRGIDTFSMLSFHHVYPEFRDIEWPHAGYLGARGARAEA